MVLTRIIFPFFYQLNGIEGKVTTGSFVWVYVRLAIGFLQVLHYVLFPNSSLPWPMSKHVLENMEQQLLSRGMKEEAVTLIIRQEAQYVEAADQVAVRLLSENLNSVFPLRLLDSENRLQVAAAIIVLYATLIALGMYVVKRYMSLNLLGSLRFVYSGLLSVVSTILYMPLLDTLLTLVSEEDGLTASLVTSLALIPVLVVLSFFSLMSESKCVFSSGYPSAHTNISVDMWLFLARTLLPFIHIFFQEEYPKWSLFFYFFLTVVPLLSTLYLIPYANYNFCKARLTSLTILSVFQMAQMEALFQLDGLLSVSELGDIDFTSTIGFRSLNEALYDGHVSTTIAIFFTPLAVFLLNQAMLSWRAHCCDMELESIGSTFTLAIRTKRYLMTMTDSLKPKPADIIHVTIDKNADKTKKKKGITFQRKQQIRSEVSSDDDEVAITVDPIEQVKNWFIQLNEKLDKDGYFYVVSYLYYSNVAKDQYFPSILYHKLCKYLQGLSWFGKLKQLHLMYLCFSFKQHLQGKSDKMERELFKYLKLQQMKKNVYQRQMDLFTRQLELYNELKEFQETGSNQSNITLINRQGDDILKTFERFTAMCKSIQDMSKLMSDLLRCNSHSSFVFRCFAQFLMAFTAQHLKAVDLFLRARDIDLAILGEHELGGKNANQQTGTSTSKSLGSVGASSRGSSYYQLNPNDMLTDTFEMDSCVLIMNGEKNQEGTIIDIFGAIEGLLHYKKQELIGSNVRRIIPSPYDQHHNEYIQNYVSFGKGSIVGKTRRMLVLDKEGFLHKVTLTVRQVVEELVDFDEEKEMHDCHDMGAFSENKKHKLIFAGVITAIDEDKHQLLVLPDGIITGMSIGCKDIWGLEPSILNRNIHIASIIPQMGKMSERHGRMESKFKCHIGIGNAAFLLHAKVLEFNDQIDTRIVEFTAEEVYDIHRELNVVQMQLESAVGNPSRCRSANKSFGESFVVDQTRYSEEQLFPKLKSMLSGSVERIMLPMAELKPPLSLQCVNLPIAEQVIKEVLSTEASGLVSSSVSKPTVVSSTIVGDYVSDFGEIQSATSKPVLSKSYSFQVKSVGVGEVTNNGTDISNAPLSSRKSIRMSLMQQKRGFLNSIKSGNDTKSYKDLPVVDTKEEKNNGSVCNTTDIIHDQAEEAVFDGKEAWIIQSHVQKTKRRDNQLLNSISRYTFLLFGVILVISVLEAVSFTSLLNELEGHIALVRTAGLRRLDLTQSVQSIQRLHYLNSRNFSTGALSKEQHFANGFEANGKLIHANALLMTKGTTCPRDSHDDSLNCKMRGDLFDVSHHAEEIVNKATLRTGMILRCLVDYEACILNHSRQRDLVSVLNDDVHVFVNVANSVAELFALVYDESANSIEQNFLWMTVVPIILSFWVGYFVIYAKIRELEYRLVNIIDSFFYLSGSELQKLISKTVDNMENLNTTFQLHSFVQDSSRRVGIQRSENSYSYSSQHVIDICSLNDKQGLGNTNHSNIITSRYEYKGIWNAYGIFTRSKSPPRLFKYSLVHILFVTVFTSIFFGLNYYFAITTVINASR
jgi:PAS domain S-box-containing protein